MNLFLYSPASRHGRAGNDNFEALSNIPVFSSHSMLEDTINGPFSRFSLL